MDPLLGRGVTVSYNSMPKSSNAIRKVYDLHIKTLVKTLLGVSIFMLLFFLMIFSSSIWYISLWDLEDLPSLVTAFAALVVSFAGLP